jgi:hypothetical protein
MKRITLYLLACTLCTTSFAQKKTKEKIKPQKSLNLKMGFRGNPNNTGFLIGAEKMFTQKKVIRKHKSGSGCFRTKQNFATLNVNFNNHFTFGNNVMLTAEWLKRTNFNDKFFIEGAAGIGYGKGIYRGPKTYVKQDDGSLKIKKPDNNYFSVNLMYGGGYNLERKTNLPIKLYAKGGITGIYYHKFGYISIIGEVGIITNLSILKKL